MSRPPLAVRTYRALLRALLPRDVWERDGEDTARTFAGMWQDATDARRRAAVAVRAFGWLPLVALAEWTDGLGPGWSAEAIARTARQSARSLLRTPAFTWSAVLLLALGVGAVTTIFTLVDHIVLRPLPYPDADRLFVVENGSHSGHDWESFQTLPSVETWAAASNSQVNLTGVGDPVRLEELSVTRDFFAVFGARPAVGRLFVDDDYAAADAVVLSYEAWARLFGRDPSVVGRTLRIDDAPALVVGVMDPSFVSPMRARWTTPDLWRPQNFSNPGFAELGFHTLSVVGRVRPGATLADAGAETHAFAERRAEEYPDFYRFDGQIRDLPVVSLQDATVADVKAGLGLLLAAVVLLLLVACANVAHLFMARGVGRAREMAVRRALGAGTRALSGQLLVESLAVASAGAVLGLGLAQIGLTALLSLSPEALPRAEEVRLDLRVLAFSLAIAALTAITFGMMPGLRVARQDPAASLRAGGRTASGDRGARRLRGMLVVGEVAVSLVLVTAAGLLLRSFQRLHDVPLGFRVENVWTLPLQVAQRTRDPGQTPVLAARMETIREALAATAGVRAATFGMTVPMEYTGGNSCCWRIDGGPPENSRAQRINVHPVGADYPAVFDPTVLAGRWWTKDEAELAPRPVVLNEPLAVALFGSAADAVGKAIVLREVAEHRVAAVIAADRHYGPDRAPRASAYVPWTDVPFPVTESHMAVLVDGADDDLAARLGRAVWSVEPDVPVPLVRSMESWVEIATAGTRFESALFSTFGAIALLLAAGGLYGTMLYTVGLQRRELGIRLALGARRHAIEARVLARGLGLAGLGAALGLLGAWASARLLEARLFGVAPRDPATLASAVAVLMAAAAVACWLPARRAAATDPLETLREE